MRGRKPKPARVQIIEGDPAKRGKRKLAERLEAEPQAPSGLPECPKELTGIARWAWDYLRRDLETMDMDKRIDALMLAGVCQMYAQAIKEKSPRAWSVFKSLACEFPFSPAARARFHIDRKEEKQEDLMAILAQPRVKRTGDAVQ